MAANTEAIFALTPNCRPPTAIVVANTASDGSGTIATVFTAGSNGSRVERVTFQNAQATAAASSAMVGKIFISDTAGANFRMRAEVLIPTITRSTTVIGSSVTYTFVGGLLLQSGQLIGAAISVRAGAQDDTVVIAEGGDF